ncbi:MAG: DUF58 domain-containing protein [Actinomycetia bacterium]|nr:DUF58 domain-containing protein [Actinomycetes bacterium]
MRPPRIWRPLVQAAAVWVVVAAAALLAVHGGPVGAHLFGAGLAAAVLAALGWLGPPGRIRVSRRLPPGPHTAGTSLEVELVVDVRGRWPGVVTVRDVLPPGLAGQGLTFVVLPWRTGPQTHRYRLTDLPRGIWTFSTIVVGWGDVFGFWRHDRPVPAADVLEVWPKTVALPESRVQPADRGPGSARLLPPFADGDDLGGVRPWVPGDRPSRIHWRTTARTGAWFVKLLEPPGLAALTVAVDDPAAFSREGFELALAVAASLVRFAAERAVSVGLVLGGPSLQMRPQPGRRHAERLMRALAAARWDPEPAAAPDRPVPWDGPVVFLTGSGSVRRPPAQRHVWVVPVGADRPGGLTDLRQLPAWLLSGRVWA